MNMLLEIKNLHASVIDDTVENGSKQILKGVNLSIPAGETHVIMGPNGSGKSTLSYVLSGHPSYKVTSGQVWFKGENLLEMSPDDRAVAGLFLAFQSPVELPGVNNANFLRSATNSVRKARSEEHTSELQSLV